MASTATITISGTIATTPYGSETISISLTNSTAVGVNLLSTLASAGASTSAYTFNPPADTRFILIVPPSTNTMPIRLGPSSASTGILLGIGGANLFTVGSTNTTYYLWTTGANAVNGVSIGLI